MRLESIRVQNYRSIRDATLELDYLTVLVGANGAGKSSFVKALELFWSGRPTVAAEDYHDRNVNDPIKITLAFGDVTKAEQDALDGPYSPDGRLVVERAFEWAGGACKPSPTYVLRHQSDELDVVRKGGTAEIKKYYKDNPGMFKKSLTGIGDIKQEFMRHEADHHAELKRSPDPDSAVNLKGAATGRPRGLVEIMFVGAVRNASDEVQDSKTSLITELTGAIADDLANSQRFTEFFDGANEEYGRIAEEVEKTDLARVEKEISKNMGNLIDGGAVRLTWPDKTLEARPPRTAVAVSEGGEPFAVERTGHGSQRALIMAMLQTLSAGPAGAAPGAGKSGLGRPSRILVVEEPELYQHPVRQRYMARFLHDLSSGPDGQRVQVIYTTHSPHFAGIDRLDGIRLIKKSNRGGGAETAVSRTSVGCVMSALGVAGGTLPAKSAFKGTLKVIMTPWLSEGFFANAVVLVEGETDYAAILGTARLLGHDFERSGISVIPCDGKPKMDRPMAIYRTLGIPTFAVWDGDRDKRAKRPDHPRDAGTGKANAGAGTGRRKSGSGAYDDPVKRKNADMNRRYLSILGNKEVDWPSKTYRNCACFEDDLEKAIKDSVGDQLFGRLLREQMNLHEIDSEKTAMKKSSIMLHVLEEAKGRGRPCRPLEDVVGGILEWHCSHATEDPAGPAAAAEREEAA